MSEQARAFGATTDVAGAASHKVRRRLFVNEMPDRGLFAIVSLIGAASIIAAKHFDISALIVAMGAIAAMILYGVVGYLLPNVRMRPDRLGDNFYYLGFIYTLSSLVAVLIKISGNPDVIESVLGGFGVALVTTIVGIAGRILFVQMRSEIDEIEEDTRRDLLERSTALRGQLGSLMADFSVLSTAMRQTTKEVIDGTQRASDLQLTAVELAATRAANKIEVAFANQQQAAERMGEMLASLTSSVEEMSHKATAMEVPGAAMEDHFRKLGEFAIKSIEAVHKESQAASQSLGETSIRMIEGSFRENISAAKTVNDTLEKTSVSTQRLIERLETVDFPNDRMEQRVSEVATAVEKSISDLRRLINGISTTRTSRKRWFGFGNTGA